jgi:AraC-like DNA-binding protein
MIKADIRENLGGPDLSIVAVATRYAVTSRYVRMLFEGEGTSFSRYLLGQRLEHSRRMLLNPRYAACTITRIAFDSGFNDLSYFNRAFRRQYGAAPREIRALMTEGLELSDMKHAPGS